PACLHARTPLLKQSQPPRPAEAPVLRVGLMLRRKSSGVSAKTRKRPSSSSKAPRTLLTRSSMVYVTPTLFVLRRAQCSAIDSPWSSHLLLEPVGANAPINEAIVRAVCLPQALAAAPVR